MNKQIEEIARIISKHTIMNCEAVPFNNIKKMVDGFCVAEVPSCGSCKAARALVNAGYRKQIEGEWKFGKENGQSGYFCTNCKAGFIGENAEWIAKSHKYCPKCGAKMKGGEA